MGNKEGNRTRSIMRYLRLQGCFCFKVWGSEHMMAGLPDIVGCYEGLFFGFEVKRPETVFHVSERQHYVLDLIREAGGIAAVVIDKDQAWTRLREASVRRQASASHDQRSAGIPKRLR